MMCQLSRNLSKNVEHETDSISQTHQLQMNSIEYLTEYSKSHSYTVKSELEGMHLFKVVLLFVKYIEIYIENDVANFCYS